MIQNLSLLPLIRKAPVGFNQQKPPDRSVILAIELSKAFDTVNHTKSLQTVSNSTLRHNYVKSLVAYSRCCSAVFRYNDTASGCHTVRTGIPQRKAISHFLFNYFVTTYHRNVKLRTGYLDYVHADESSVDS